MTIETAATLLEREQELAALEVALAEAREGRGQIVLLEAPAGLGKTSLLRAAARLAGAAGFVRLRARASELERDFAYGCVRQLFEPAVTSASSAAREHLFDGAAGLAKPLVPGGGPRLVPSADSAFSILHGLYWLLNNLAAEAPVLVAVDDLQWADAESLRFLAFLAPRLDGLPVVVLATTRPGERATDVARLAAGPETSLLRPGPLSNEATSTLCRQRLGAGVSAEFAAACREATGGNPLFLEALLREVIEQRLSTEARDAGRVRGIGPAGVAEAVLLRLSGRPAATALVRAVAVLGDGASLSEAAELSGLTDADAAAAADLLVEVAILQPAARLGFAHPVVREAVYSDIGPGARARAHADAARMLAARGASEERIAAQIVAAQPVGDAARVELLRRVARDALGRGAPAASAAWLVRALAEPPPASQRGELLLELGAAELRSGAAGAVEHLTAAVELIREPALLARSARELANALNMAGEGDRAFEAIESAIEVVQHEDRELALLLEAELAAKAQQGRLELRARADGRLERHGELAGATPGERLVLASRAFERARASESSREAADCIGRALAGGRLLQEHEVDVVGPFYALVIGLLATDALDLASDWLEQALADARGASIPALAYLLAHRAAVALRRGAVAAAEADSSTALELLSSHDIRLGRRFALGLLIEALIEGGDVAGAQHALEGSGLGAQIPAGLASNNLLEARGLLHVAQGRTREGVEDLVEFGRRDEVWGAANPLASRWRSRAALALVGIGEAEQASRLAAEDLERALRWGAGSGIGVALRAVALAEGGVASIDRLRESTLMLERSPARLEQARALTDLGAALRRANRRVEARAVLGDGLQLAERCGARALASRARAELNAAGGWSSDPEGSGAAQLTASERRVADLAAEGLSNPEIAQALFVTRKTVETHLGHVYRKLDISGRGELAGALGDRSSSIGA